MFPSLSESAPASQRRLPVQLLQCLPGPLSRPAACAAHCRTLSVFLREPCQHVRRILWRHDIYQRRLEKRRNQPLSATGLRRVLLHTRFPQRDDYASLLATDRRARILAAFHFGDYVYGLHTLVNCVAHPGLVRVLSLQAGSTAYWGNVRAAFGDRAPGPEAELLSSNTSVSTLSAFLREAGNTLLLFCDLPAGNGELSAVSFLQRPAWFPRGAATLALLNRVPLVPVITCTHKQQSWLLLFPQIEPVRRADEPLGKAAARITQTLVKVLEQYLVHYPEQWRYLQTLPAYFTSPPTAQPTGTR